MPETRDERLLTIARRRARFRRKVYSYAVLLVFFWIIWWITSGKFTGFTGYPWPIWIMLGFGISLAREYFKAYKSDEQLLDSEYEKLKKEEEIRNSKA